jgi:hexosaminidase
LRVHAENAIILIGQARAAGPLREADAADAMELGARRIDFIGYKFEAAQNLIDEYHRAYSEQANSSGRENVGRELSNISGINGQCQDLRDGYGLIRDLYHSAYLQENRPYWLDNLMAEYDLAMQRWISRGRQFNEIGNQWDKTGKLPKPEDVGLPPISGTPAEGAASPAQ